jgi:hypothetical protein
LFAGEKTSQEGWEKVDRTMENIKSRYGDKVIRRATLKEE